MLPRQVARLRSVAGLVARLCSVVGLVAILSGIAAPPALAQSWYDPQWPEPYPGSGAAAWGIEGEHGINPARLYPSGHQPRTSSLLQESGTGGHQRGRHSW
jgi:hypothetical protein